jgi:hypothetical protein
MGGGVGALIAGIADIARHRRDRKIKPPNPTPILGYVTEVHANLGSLGMTIAQVHANLGCTREGEGWTR